MNSEESLMPYKDVRENDPVREQSCFAEVKIYDSEENPRMFSNNPTFGKPRPVFFDPNNLEYQLINRSEGVPTPQKEKQRKMLVNIHSKSKVGRDEWFKPIVNSIFEKIEFVEKIGAGKNSRVYTCYIKQEDEIKQAVKKLFAVKILEKKFFGDFTKKIQIMLEINILSFLDHKNIVKFHNLFEDEERIYLIMDYLQNFVDLKTYTKESSKKLQSTKVVVISQQILDAMSFCHSAGVYHRDLNLNNVMINPRTLELKIIDFGLACCTMPNTFQLIGQVNPPF